MAHFDASSHKPYTSQMGTRVRSFGLFLVFVGIGLGGFGCTNLLSTGTNASTGGGGGVLTPSPGDSGNYAFEILHVVRSNQTPDSTIDLVGQNGEMGANCSVSESTTPTTPACQCNYSFIRSTGAAEEFSVDALYYESNLVRCPLIGIASDVSTVNVRVDVTVGGETYPTNTVQFPLSGLNQFIDPQDPSNYLKPLRYQCRDMVWVEYPFATLTGNSDVYDPIVSENARLSYPLNFYSSNLYRSIAGLVTNANPANLGGAGWYCPTTPNASFSSSDLAVFSAGADALSSLRIFPPAGSAFDRSTFFLLKKASGIFSVPVHAIVAPNTVSDETATNANGLPGPLGYGVTPITQTNGTETCPASNIPIPTGFQWVKVWQFRSSLDQRAVPKSQRFTQMTFACNAGSFSTGQSVQPACADAGRTLASSDDSVLADRAVYAVSAGGQTSVNTACMNLQHGTFASDPSVCNDVDGPGSGAGCTTKSTGAQKATYSNLARGTDVWRWILDASNNPAGGSALTCGGASQPNDFLNFCTQPLDEVVPFDPNVEWVPLGTSATDGTVTPEPSRYDYLYVVTPTTVHVKDMTNTASSIALPYIPYRFYPGGCVSGNPASPAFTGDCAAANRINYAIKLHDVRYNGDAPPGEPGRNPVFPICALQPKP